MPLKLSGVRLPHYKNTSGSKAVIMPPPETVTIPMIQHIGSPSVPVVKAGDTVTVGQLIATAGGYVGAPIHSSVSGTVKNIEKLQLSDGRYTDAITVVSDGRMTPCDSLSPVTVDSYDSFISAVRDSGAVGFGGAGFPTAVKLDVKDLSRIDTVIINGAECEPYITSDTRTMLDDSDDLTEGLKLLNRFLKVANIIIGIENNKYACIKEMRQKTAELSFVKVKALKSIYPQGGEKVLIFNTTGRVVPEGKLPVDVGIIVLNCTTLAAVAKYIRTGMPVVSKRITVDGSAVAEPKNITVPIGTAISDVLSFAGGLKNEAGKVMYGGPMMGITVKDTSLPIMKNNNAVIVLDEKDSTEPVTTPCVRCGKCISHCPVMLNPVMISKAYSENDTDALKKLKVGLCMECGCCSYVCPTKQPLVQRNKLSKALVKRSERKETAQ